jgi:hypothetical protein
MAWQLIYTSSARLLEAGRTGFGTVARHRAISAHLTGKLESISQFARLPGYDPDRVIFSHRVIEAGGRHFHILSSIRSAGSDYTGRTNHIAHHLVISEEEARDLAQRSVTPVDVLRAMEWRSSWDSAARYLEDSDEVDLSQLPPTAFDVWSGVTGLADHARLPWSPQAAKGCCIVLTNHADATLFAGEALLQNPGRSWEISFTTHLEPNDGLSDFRWVFLYPDSIARSQAEQSARPLYDLTTPGLLPEPPAPLQPAATAKPSSTHLKVSSPSFAPPSPPGLDQGSQWGLEKLADSKTTRRVGTGERVTVVLGSGTAAAPKRSRKWAWVAVSLVVVAVAVVAGWQMHSQAELEKQRMDLVKRVEEIWKRARDKKSQDPLVGEVQKADAMRISDLKGWIEELESLVKNIDDSIKTRTDKIKGMLSNDDALEPFRSLPIRVKKWLNAHRNLVQMLNGAEVNWRSLSSAINNEKMAWVDVESIFRTSVNPHQDLVAELQSKAIKLLEDEKWSVQEYGAAEKVVQQLGLADREEIKNTLACWRQLSLLTAGALNPADYEKWQKTADLPAWLKKEVENLAPRKPAEPARQAYAATVPAPQSIPAKNPIQMPTTTVNAAEKPKEAKSETKPVDTYFVLIKPNGEIESPVLPIIKKGITLVVKSLESSDSVIELEVSDPTQDSTISELWARTGRARGAKDSIVFASKKLVRLPSKGVLEKNGAEFDCRKNFIITPTSSQPFNFEIIVLNEKPRRQLLTMDRRGDVVEVGASTYDIQLNVGLDGLNWPAGNSVEYLLRSAESTSDDKSVDINLGSGVKMGNNFNINLRASVDEKSIDAKLRIKKAELNDVKKDIDKDGGLKDKVWDIETNKEKLSQKQKEEKLQFAQNSLQKKESLKSELEHEIAELEKQKNSPPPPPPKPDGQYNLFAKVGDLEFKLCLVDLK